MNKRSLRYRCQQPDEELLEGRSYRLIDNGSPVLAVAHCDTVSAGCSHYFEHRGRVWSTALDDRLGVHILLDLLPARGVVVDVLLTDDEEVGASTAAEFQKPPRQYNWMFQFDRHGTGAVTYDFDSMRTHLSGFFRPEHGTFSDICRLEHLGCAGLNVGTGYYLEHTPGSYAVWGDVWAQVKRFEKFFSAKCSTRIPHQTASACKRRNPLLFSSYDRDYTYDYDYEDLMEPDGRSTNKCEICEKKVGGVYRISEMVLCKECWESLEGI